MQPARRHGGSSDEPRSRVVLKPLETGRN